MTTQNSQRLAGVIHLWFEESIRDLIAAVLPFDDFTVTSVQTAADALTFLEHNPGRYAVLMDNYFFSDEPLIFATTVFARPELHQRVRVIGVFGPYGEQNKVPLDEHLETLKADILFDAIDRAGTGDGDSAGRRRKQHKHHKRHKRRT